MTQYLEFHDSVLIAFSATKAHAELLLDAYIHRWQKVDGEWAGTGWMQSVRIAVSHPIGQLTAPVLPADISDGRLSVGTKVPVHLVPFPLEASAAVGLRLQLTTAEVIELGGSRVRVQAAAEARFVEDLPAAMRPPDAG